MAGIKDHPDMWEAWNCLGRARKLLMDMNNEAAADPLSKVIAAKSSLDAILLEGGAS